jgi:hypothetical protein
MWYFATTIIRTRLRTQLNTILFAKTLVRKDVVSSSGAPASVEKTDKKVKNTDGESKDKDEKEDEFSSKAQIMTLMTTDVDRVAEFSFHLFAIAGEISQDAELLFLIFFSSRLPSRDRCRDRFALQHARHLVFHRPCSPLSLLAIESFCR